MTVKVDGKEIGWRKIAYRDEPAPLTGAALVAKIRQLEADDRYDSPEYDDLISRRLDEIEAAHVRPKCCEPAGKTIRFSLDVGDCEDTDLVKAGRWHIGEHPVTFCPFCSRRLPDMRRKSTGKTCRVTDGGYYCAACNERLQGCLCDPMDAAFEEVPVSFAAIMIAHSETQAALERGRMRWAAEKSVSRLNSADDMRWVLRQAGDDCEAVERFLVAWDLIASAGLSPRRVIAEMGRQRRIAVEDAPALVSVAFDSTHKEIHDRISRQITAKLLGPEFTFSPTDKVWLSSGHKPIPGSLWVDEHRRFINISHDDGPGIWRPIVPPSPGRGSPGDLALRLAMYLALEWTL